MKFELIVAHDEGRGMGHNNTIPWFIPGELKWVANVTKAQYGTPDQRNALIMGRNTWESLPDERRPLPGRLTIIVSLSLESTINNANVIVARSLDEAFHIARQRSDIAKAFIFGGASIYKQAMARNELDYIRVSVVPGKHKADTLFPPIPDCYKATEQYDINFDGIIVKHTKMTRHK
jgi:dihydrofolate reductase